ncbi:hypothetical protein [Massilia sp. TSP1-1-2]|uniref:hypothetical protein n=1 Tax=Massilia sp. TSP1-1-2 TaxID=2804649 RepID=UPI003CECE9AA
MINKVPVLLPDWTLWIVVPLAALVFSAFLVGCMLCVHADPGRYRKVLRITVVRRTLVWIPVSLVPFFLFAFGLRLLRSQAWWDGVARSGAGGLISSALGWTLLLALTILILVLWAALSLQTLRSLQSGQAGNAPLPRLPVAPATHAQRGRRKAITAPARATSRS